MRFEGALKDHYALDKHKRENIPEKWSGMHSNLEGGKLNVCLGIVKKIIQSSSA